MSLPKVIASVFTAGLVAAALTACSGGSGGSTTPSADGAPELTELTVAALPIPEVAPLYLAIQEGFFEDEGLTVNVEPTQGGAASVPAMVAGDLDVTFGQNVSFLVAVQQGLPLLSVAQTTAIGEKDPGNGVFVAGSSPIKTPADLADATIAVNTLNNITQLRTLVDLESENVPIDNVKFIEMALGDVPPALAAGRIEAAYSVEPFTTMIKDDGGRLVLDTVDDTLTGIPVGGFAVTQQFAKKNPNTVAAFQRAMAKGSQIAIDDPDAVRKILATYTSLNADQLQRVALPTYIQPDDTSGLQTLADLMFQYGFIDEKMDAAPFESVQ